MTVPRSITCTSPETLSLPHRQRRLDREDDAFDERPLDVDHAQRRLAGDDSYRGLPVGRPHRAVRPASVDRPHSPVAREAPGEQPGEICIPPFAGRAPEQRGVDRDAAATGCGDLRPAGAVRVARLDADQIREGREQVVPRVQAPAGRFGLDAAERSRG